MILYNILYYNTMNNSVQSAISYGLRSLGYSEAMDAQRRVIEAYMAGRDVLMVAPTGSGKSLIFQIAPFVFDHLRHGERENISSVCIVVAPLLSLMHDQVDGLRSKGISLYQLFVWMPKHLERLLIAFVVASLTWSFVVQSR